MPVEKLINPDGIACADMFRIDERVGIISRDLDRHIQSRLFGEGICQAYRIDLPVRSRFIKADDLHRRIFYKHQ